MALTNYRLYRWVINTLENADEYGYSFRSLQDLYKQFRSATRKTLGIKRTDEQNLKGPESLKRTTFYNWRVQIWVQFSLIIDTPVYDNYYALINKELLDENKKLRDMIDLLVEEEERGTQTETLIFSKRGRKPKNTQQPVQEQVMGFVSAGGGDVDYCNPQYGKVEEPEIVGILRFLMTIGEALVIEYGKAGRPKEKPNRYVLEPQQLKCINGRWYVAGILYEYGNRESARVSIYDVERIRICEDEDIVSPRYEVVEGFDICNLLPADWTNHFNPDKVVSMYLRTLGNVIEKHPFCQAQELVESVGKGIVRNLYKVYVRPDQEFLIQYLAYGDELVVFNPHNRIERTPIDITDDQIKYLKGLRKTKL